MSARFPQSRFVAEASINGTLYDLGEYPGLSLDDSSMKVFGEIYEIDDETLKSLDEFEISTNYRRKQVEASLTFGKKLVWVYEPDPAFHELGNPIASGDWIAHLKSKSA